MVLVALRAACAFLSWGFIHPDEYFQSVEVSARDVFGRQALIPWEYESSMPSRSVLNLFSSSTLPFLIVSAATSTPSASCLLLATRLFSFTKSLLLDLLVGHIATLAGADADCTRVLLASLWPVMVLMVRPFSNANEAILLAASIVTALSSNTALWRRLVLSGVLMAGVRCMVDCWRCIDVCAQRASGLGSPSQASFYLRACG